MAIPRVFVSSTCYDLKYIRENLKYFIKTIGYDPVLSEEGSIFFDPTLDTNDSCLREIPSCQMFVLVVGGRFGSIYKDSGKSITNTEYKEAVKSKIPVFALVDSAVLSEFYVYQKNKTNKEIDYKKIGYPSADSTRIFDFIEEVRGSSVNNALVPFNDFSDIESYLKLQWAGMMFSFLTKQNEDQRVADTLSALTKVSEKVEFLSKQILESIGSEEAKILSESYDIMIGYECFRDLTYWGLKPSPKDIIKYENFEDCSAHLGKNIVVEKNWQGLTIAAGGKISISRYNVDGDQYLELRKNLLGILKKHGISSETFLKSK